jgi:hypothetical protein
MFKKFVWLIPNNLHVHLWRLAFYANLVDQHVKVENRKSHSVYKKCSQNVI